MNPISKTHAYVVPRLADWNVCDKRSGIHRKSIQFRVARENMEAETACVVTEKEEDNRERTSLFRYRDSPEEIQGVA
jgi:hypothetical protein